MVRGKPVAARGLVNGGWRLRQTGWSEADGFPGTTFQLRVLEPAVEEEAVTNVKGVPRGTVRRR